MDTKRVLEQELARLHDDIVRLVRKAAKDPSLEVTSVSASKVMWEADRATLLKAAYYTGQVDQLLNTAEALALDVSDSAKKVVGLKDALFMV